MFLAFASTMADMGVTELLTTGEVARMLGTSRQHVVDLCERGDLPCVRTGTHRRVPRAAAEELLDKASRNFTRDQERSLWLHRVVSAQLVTDPDTTLTKARENLLAWRGAHRSGGMSERWLGQWTKILDGGVDEVAAVLTSESRRAVELRQNSPFAGVLAPDVRGQVLTAFARHWRQVHVARHIG